MCQYVTELLGGQHCWVATHLFAARARSCAAEILRKLTAFTKAVLSPTNTHNVQPMKRWRKKLLPDPHVEQARTTHEAEQLLDLAEHPERDF